MTDRITLDHGSGGKASHDLVQRLFLRHFDNDILRPLEDSALLAIGGERLAFSTDSYVVDPLFFPGGNIGDLAVNGTVNDLAMRGAQPRYLSVGMILEEGLPLADLEAIVESMHQRAVEAGVRIVAGDTKVVPAGKADKLFINTTGLGTVAPGVNIAAGNIRPGDHLLVSGSLADHGVTVLCQREGLRIKGSFQSDSAPLHDLVAALLAACGPDLHTLRDPTRGGLATTLCELALSSQVGIKIKEAEIPVHDDVRGACELLGLDPLYLANEGKLLAFVAPGSSDQALAALRRLPHGAEARLIGQAVAEHSGRVWIETAIGTERLLDMLFGTPLPRIC
ncbi:MAG: hydrogenase expression/formation protein HypE [Deltaproteobacteria bacterium]